MLRDIESCRQLGCDGVVIGALTVDGDVDVALCRDLVRGGCRLALKRTLITELSQKER